MNQIVHKIYKWMMVLTIIAQMIPNMSVMHVHAEEHVYEENTEISLSQDERFSPLYSEISVEAGQLNPETLEILESDVYASVVGLKLVKGNILSINNTDYVFSVRKFVDGNYNTVLKQATTASFTVTEDMTVAMLIRKPDKSELTQKDINSIVMQVSNYSMIDVEGAVHRFTVEAKTIDGGIKETRAAVFMPDTYTDNGKETPLIVMTHGYSGYLNDSVWYGNAADNTALVENYLEAGYAVLVVDNTAAKAEATADIGCPQLVSSYLEAQKYVAETFNVEQKFSIHSRSFGTFAAIRIMHEVPELVKCAVMTGARVSTNLVFANTSKTIRAFIAKSFGYEDVTGSTYEKDKMTGYDPYTDIKNDPYKLPPTYWVLAAGDETERPLEFIEQLKVHGNDASVVTYEGVTHNDVCKLTSEDMISGALKFLAKYQKESIKGKKLSILGASISTFAGASNGAAADTTNSTIRNNAKYYPNDTIPEVTLNDTWWMQVAEDLGLELLVNNAWSGSAILLTRSGTVGAYVDRCVQLHDNTGDNAGEEPDIIGIQMGFNDFSYDKSTLGDANIDYDALISKDGYAEPATTMEATAIMLDKMTKRYPDAEIYMFNHFKRIGQSVSDTALMEELNESIKTVCDHYGVTVVDLYTVLNSADLIGDGKLHPNKLGMDAMSEAFKRELIKNTDYAVETHTVSLKLDNVKADYVEDKILVDGDSYEVNLSFNVKDEVTVKVMMGNEDITLSSYSDGKVFISEVTDDVTVTASAVHVSKHYLWELEETGLNSKENNLTKLAGTVTDGQFNKVIYELNDSVVLKHDLPWMIEWKSTGSMQNTSGSGARMFTSTKVNAEYNARYLFKSSVNGLIAMGEKTTTGSHNYGLELADYGIDATQEHVYVLKNRINQDGTNMIYLSVDGKEIGPMNHYYVGTTDKNTTSNWLSGQDFVFPFMGTDSHGLTNCSINYIEIWEEKYPKVSDYAGKVISIYGDSISTFAGYIPVADGFNLEHLARYPQDDLLTDVNETWWMQVIDALDAKLGINDSWRGATVSGAHAVTTGTTGENASFANLTRVQNLGSNGTPDVILFYGGTNDLAHVSKVGTFDAASVPSQVDLTTKKWDNLADGYVHTLLRLKHYYPEAVILAMLPTYTASYYTEAKLAQANEVLKEICDHYDIPWVDLRECGLTTSMLPDGIHPDAEGMDCITEAVLAELMNQNVESGEHVVYSITHNLNHVTASHSYLKGVSAGKSFFEVLGAENEFTVTVMMGGKDVTESVYKNGKIQIIEVTGDVVITAESKFSLGVHLKELPEELCEGINLWEILEHDDEYYSVDGWTVHSSNKVTSVTFAVEEGMKIFASSFEAAGTNGGTVNGIRVTYFNEDGVLKSMSADEVYAEFSKNGVLTVPANATHISIPMWTTSDKWEVYLLSAEHEYEGITCTICGETHPEAKDYEGKVVSILSASTSTFAGYIPVADGFNLEHRSRYPQDDLLTDVNETWWMQVLQELDAKLGINESWAGSQVLNTQDNNSGDLGPDAAMASLTRIQNLGSNGTPDMILFYGGGNDMGRGVAAGTFDPAKAPTEVDLTTTKWTNFADAYTAAIMRLQYFYPDTQIVVMTSFEMPSYVTASKLNKYGPIVKAICDHYGVPIVDLRDCGISSAELPDGIHPNAKGMDYITNDVLETLMDSVDMTSGENTVYTVEHHLTNAQASLGYYKGISAGNSFTETLSGENLNVTVTMGGTDITSSVYRDGKISIEKVTGNLVITAAGKFNVDGHLQQLPEEMCAGVNLWTALKPENIYYTEDGWGLFDNSPDVHSITFPVTEGDQIWSTSFQKAPLNGASSNATRITWFSETGLLKTVNRDTVYREFTANGYITAPKGAVAVNVPMYSNNDGFEVFVLNAEHDYEPMVTAPSSTTPGYTIYQCSSCDDNYRAETIDASWFEGKTLVAIGDGITAGVGVTKGETDYSTLIGKKLGMSVVNRGVSGTTLATGGPVSSNFSKLDNLPADTDIVTILMGIHDYSHAVKNGYYQTKPKYDADMNCYELGTINSMDTTTIYGALHMWAQKIVELKKTKTYKDVQFYFITPVITSWNVSVTSTRDWDQSKVNIHGITMRDICNAMIEVSELYDIPMIDLNITSGLYYNSATDNSIDQFGGDGAHPGVTGHQLMAEAIVKHLKQEYLRDDHEHAYGSWIVAVYPTCTTAAVEKRVCKECGKTESRTLDALGHDYESVITEPTCTEGGYTTHTCERCDDTYTDAETDKLGHDYTTVVTAPTCEEAGYTTYTCIRGDHTDVADHVEALGHEEVIDAAVEATCTETGLTEGKHCERCDEVLVAQTITDKLGHDYESVVTVPTCEEAGYTTYTCTRGDHTDVADHVEALGHEEVINEAVEATCTETGLTEGKHCERCNKVLIEQKITDKLGHSYGEWFIETEPTYETEGVERRDCVRCDVYETRSIEMKKHHYTSVVIVPTCEQQGYTLHTCSECGDSYKDNFVSVLAHNYGELKDVITADCTNGGTKVHQCETCGREEIIHVEPLGHKYKAEVIKPTCTESGYTVHTCERCMNSYTESYIKAKGHVFGEWGTVISGSCDEGGMEMRDCESCDYYETRKTEKLGHHYEAIVTQPDCIHDGYTTYTCTRCDHSYVADNVEATGHGYGEWFIEEKATCQNTGLEKRICTGCGCEETRITAKTDHVSIIDPAKESTCTETGLTEGMHCDVCKEVLVKQEIIAKAEHVYESVVSESTCLEAGYTTHICKNCNDCYIDAYTELGEHRFSDWMTEKEATLETEGLEYRECEVCHEIERRILPAKQHSYTMAVVEATCEENGYIEYTCIECGHCYQKKVEDALGHDYDEWTVFKEASCTSEGIERRDCTRCNKFEIRTLEAEGHDYKETVHEPTCIKMGYTLFECKRCGSAYEGSFVEATGHTFDEWKPLGNFQCLEKGAERRDCEVCDAFESRETEALGHDYEIIATDISCTEKGKTTYQCTRCKDSYIEENIEPLGHQMTEWKISIQPSCTKQGEELRECARCNHVETRSIEAIGHHYVDKGTAPTCTNSGLKAEVCEHCGDKKTEEELKAIGHNWITKNVEVSCSRDGYSETSCQNCGESKRTNEVKALGHSFGEYISDDNATVDKDGTKTSTCSRCGAKDTIDDLGTKKVISFIEITRSPSKLTYSINEELDFSDLELTVTYTDGTSEAVLEYEISGYKADYLGEQQLTISYRDFSEQITVHVEDKTEDIQINDEVKQDSSKSPFWTAIPVLSGILGMILAFGKKLFYKKRK